MKATKHLLALAVAGLIAGCGGGSDGPQATAVAASPLRTPPGALAVVTRESAANQLMDFAEGRPQFHAFFPEHQASQTDVPPFLYRHYSSGAYLGVVVTENPDFILGGVYTLGGPLGALTYQGQVTDFIVPVDTGGGGSGNGCYDLALFDTQGTHLEITYQYSGSVTGTQNVETLVGALTTFQGQSARETTVTTSGTNFSAGLQLDGTFTGRNYARRTGDAEITQFGSIFNGTGTSQGQNLTMNFTSVFNPAFVDRQYSLALGQTFNSSQTLVTTGTMSLQGSSIPFGGTTTQSYSVTYAAQESVSVPAGTYNTCRLQTTTTASSGTTTQTSWVIVGKGIPVKTTTTAAGFTQTIEASSVKLNGSPI